MDTIVLDIIIAQNIEHEQNLSSEHWERHQHWVSCSALQCQSCMLLTGQQSLGLCGICMSHKAPPSIESR